MEQVQVLLKIFTTGGSDLPAFRVAQNKLEANEPHEFYIDERINDGTSSRNESGQVMPFQSCLPAASPTGLQPD